MTSSPFILTNNLYAIEHRDVTPVLLLLPEMDLDVPRSSQSE